MLLDAGSACMASLLACILGRSTSLMVHAADIIEPEEKVYPLLLLYRICYLFLPLCGGAITVYGMLCFFPSFPLSTSFGDALRTTLIGMVLLLVLLPVYRASSSTQLVLTADGITFSLGSTRLYTPWHNVVGSGAFHLSQKKPFSGIRPIPALTLREHYVFGMSVAQGRWLAKAVIEANRRVTARSLAFYAGYLPIPKTIGGSHWQGSELGRDIRRHAPWVFADQNV